MKRKNKYNAVKVVINGNTCDSKLEAKHYNDLLLCQKQGEIKDLQFHPRFDAIVNNKKLGTIELDFKFYDNVQEQWRYVDSKGVYTTFSKWKHKHLEAQEGIKVEIWRT